jgi:CrcB protein
MKGKGMQTVLLIGIGGFIGAVSRFLLSAFVQKSAGVLFPLGTLSVNLVGGFLIGFLALYFESHLSVEYRLLVITGFLGALTTFSTFSYETVMLIENAAYLKAFGNIFLNVFFSLSATILGMLLYKKLYL